MRYRPPRPACTILVAFLAGCAAPDALPDPADQVLVASSESLDVTRSSIPEVDEDDPDARRADPVSLALDFVGPFEGTTQRIVRENDDPEATRTTITVIEDGYLDDSVRGAWYRLTLELGPDGLWSLTGARRAWRCWPGRGHEEFSAEPCL